MGLPAAQRMLGPIRLVGACQLPAAAMTIQGYGPEEELIQGDWSPPPVKMVQ
jgi:hypothetical protein